MKKKLKKKSVTLSGVKHKFNPGDITLIKYKDDNDYWSDEIISIDYERKTYRIRSLETKDGSYIGEEFNESIRDYDRDFELHPKSIWNKEISEIING